MRKLLRSAALIGCTVVAADLTSIAVGQTSPGSSPATDPPSRALNAWMKVPSLLSEAASVNPDLRYDRDAFFDSGNPEPLTPETASTSHISEGATYGDPPEIPPLDGNLLLVVGRFDRYHSVLSASHRSVYTEVRIVVTDVINELPEKQIRTQSDLTVALLGGTVQLEDGRVLSYLTDNKQFSLQPGHQYLLLLAHQSTGDFFLEVKNWDVTDGVVRPNTAHEVERAHSGKSHLSGLTLTAALTALKSGIIQPELQRGSK